MSDATDWEYRTIGEIAKLTGGSAFKEVHQGGSTGEIPFIKVSDFNIPENHKYIVKANNWISHETSIEIGAKVFPPGAIVFPKVGAALLSNRRRILSVPTAIDNNLMAAIPIDCHPEFLHIALCEVDFTKFVQDGAVPSINQEQVSSIEIAAPPLPEQKKIAEILSGIDNQTKLLQKGIQAKQNLRSALLSEIITENAPITKLDSVASRVSGHTPSKSHSEYWNGGIPWVSLTDTSKLDSRYISHTAKHISEEGIKNSSAVLHPPGLVILSRDARVGCSAITTRNMAVSQHFIGWTCSEKLLNKYLYYLLQKWKPRFEAIAMGSTIPTIGVPFFRDLEIPVPPMQTQERIAQTLESVDSEIAALSNKVAMLRVLKSEVSSDLLSGRKRVSV